MATFRLYVTSIGGLPAEALKSLFARFGEVEEAVILSPRGNPVAIVVLHSDSSLQAICETHLAYSLTADNEVIESGVLGIRPAREKSDRKNVTKANPPASPLPVSSRAKRARVSPSCGPKSDLSGSLGSWHQRGFTFINSDAGDFFCHMSGLHETLFDAEGSLKDSKSVEEHTRVVFDAIQDPRDSTRLRAVNVRPVDVAPSPALPLPNPQESPAQPLVPEKPNAAPVRTQLPEKRAPVRNLDPTSNESKNIDARTGSKTDRSRSLSPPQEGVTTSSRGRTRSRPPKRIPASRGAALVDAVNNAGLSLSRKQ